MGMCPQEIQQQVQAYHDGELPAQGRAAVEAHLAVCADCTSELTRLRALSAALRDWAPVMPAGAMERLYDRTHDLEQETLILPLVRRLTGLAAAVLLAGSIWLSTQHQPAVTTPAANSAANPTFASATSPAVAPTPELPEAWEHTAVTLNTESSVDVQLADWIIEPSGGTR